MLDANLKNQWASAVRWKEALPSARRFTVPVILMSFILWFVCFFGLNSVALIDLVDEGLYADAARQMIDSGDWVTPRFGPNAFLGKPPLTFWCQAFFIRLLGPTTLSARLPSAIAAFLTALILWYWAMRKGFMDVGWLAAVLYVLCPLVALGLARVGMMDSLLTLWFTLAVVGWIEGYGGSRKGYLLMAAGMGLAVMTKGAIGFLLPGLVFSIWLFIRRDLGALLNVPWAAALTIFLLLTLPWHLAVWRANGNLFLREYLMHHHVQRLLGQDFGHNGPFWYYIPHLTLSMFPWSAFVPLAWWQSLRGWRSERQSLNCMLAMWGVWAVVVVLFFSVSASKLPSYVLPALPALVLLSARRLDSRWRVGNGLSALESAILGGLGSLLGLLLLTVGVLGWQWRSSPSSPSWVAKWLGTRFNWKEQAESISLLWCRLTPVTHVAPYLITLGALLLLTSIMVLACWRNTSKTVVSAMSMSLFLIVLIVHFVLPAWSAYEVSPLNTLGQRTLPALQRGEPLVIYALHPQPFSLHYTLGHENQIFETFSPDNLQNVLRDAGHAYILTTKDTTLPSSSGTLQQEATAGQWALWRYNR